MWAYRNAWKLPDVLAGGASPVPDNDPVPDNESTFASVEECEGRRHPRRQVRVRPGRRAGRTDRPYQRPAAFAVAGRAAGGPAGRRRSGRRRPADDHRSRHRRETSEATVIRFCRSVGMDGYPQLRIRLAAEAARRIEPPDARVVGGDIPPGADLAQIIATIAFNDARAVEETAEQLDPGCLRTGRRGDRRRRPDRRVRRWVQAGSWPPTSSRSCTGSAAPPSTSRTCTPR